MIQRSLQTDLAWIPCKVERGAFSDEWCFAFFNAQEFEYQGVAPTSAVVFDGDRSPVGIECRVLAARNVGTPEEVVCVRLPTHDRAFLSRTALRKFTYSVVSLLSPDRIEEVENATGSKRALLAQALAQGIGMGFGVGAESDQDTIDELRREVGLLEKELTQLKRGIK